MTDKHIHTWQTMDKKMLSCTVDMCNTVSSVDDVIENAERRGAFRERLTIYSEQLFGNHLKKGPHDAAYAWVRKHNPDSLNIQEATKQPTLF